MPWPLTQPSALVATDVTAQTTRHADDHNKIAALLAVVTPGVWQVVNPSGGAAPAFVSPWANYGGGYVPARFRREGGDICRLEGTIAGGNAATTAFTLPVGFRPAYSIRFAQSVQSVTSPSYIAWLTILADGSVQPQYLVSGSGAVAVAHISCTFAIDPATL